MKKTRLVLAVIAASVALLILIFSLMPRRQVAAPAPGIDRSGKLLAMAGEEAASIPKVLDRFTRQLNIADTQLRTGRKPDAAKTLALARDTLNVARKEDFDDFHRIAAWTAISQLARGADDRDLALKSSDLALAALNDVQPAAERPQYVLSLAAELATLRGNAAAVELLASGGSWAAEIVNPDVRRVALIAFTDRLLTYEGYENARTMLRRDPDPAWRTDTFLALAGGLQQAPDARYDRFAQAKSANTPAAAYANAGGGRSGGGAGGGSAVGASPATAPSPTDARDAAQDKFRAAVSQASTYGKDVRFESVYKQN